MLGLTRHRRWGLQTGAVAATIGVAKCIQVGTKESGDGAVFELDTAHRRAAGITEKQLLAENAQPGRMRQYRRLRLAVMATEGARADQHRQLALTQIQCRSEEHTSELKSLMRISYAVF